MPLEQALNPILDVRYALEKRRHDGGERARARLARLSRGGCNCDPARGGQFERGQLRKRAHRALQSRFQIGETLDPDTSIEHRLQLVIEHVEHDERLVPDRVEITILEREYAETGGEHFDADQDRENRQRETASRVARLAECRSAEVNQAEHEQQAAAGHDEGNAVPDVFDEGVRPCVDEPAVDADHHYRRPAALHIEHRQQDVQLVIDFDRVVCRWVGLTAGELADRVDDLVGQGCSHQRSGRAVQDAAARPRQRHRDVERSGRDLDWWLGQLAPDNVAKQRRPGLGQHGVDIAKLVQRSAESNLGLQPITQTLPNELVLRRHRIEIQ